MLYRQAHKYTYVVSRCETRPRSSVVIEGCGTNYLGTITNQNRIDEEIKIRLQVRWGILHNVQVRILLFSHLET